LAPVGDPALVPAVLAAALGVREQPGVPAAEVLAGVLARLQLLVVLDNCEHVIGAAAELCGGLLAAADDLQILATSREPLRVAGAAGGRGPAGGRAAPVAGGRHGVELPAAGRARAAGVPRGLGVPGAVHAGGGRGGRGPVGGPGGAAAGGLLAAEPAAGWPGR